MTNKQIQKRYFIKGTIMLCGAVFAITILPYIFHNYLKQGFENYIFTEIEFIMLAMCGIFYIFCPRYYKLQYVAILIAFLLYYALKFGYPLIFK